MPTLRALKAMGAPYKGVIYAGVMVTDQGPRLIEYNARFGDPESQVLIAADDVGHRAGVARLRRRAIEEFQPALG